MSVIANLDVVVRGQGKHLEDNLKKSEEKLSGFANAAKGAGEKIKSSLGAAFTPIAGMVAGFLPALLAAGLSLGAIAGQFNEIGSAAKTSAKLGMAIEDFQGLSYAARKTGVDTESFTASMQRMQANISKANLAGHGLAETFGEMGEGAEGFNGKGIDQALKELHLKASELVNLRPDQQIRKIADGLQQVTNSGDRARDAVALFGRSGYELVAALKDGSAGLDAFQKKAEALGLVVSGEQAQQVKEAKAALNEIKEGFTGIARQLAVAFAPLVKWFADIFTDLAPTIRKALDYIVPIVRQWVRVLGAAFEFLGRLVSMIWEGIKEGIAAVLRAIGVDPEQLMGNLRKGIVAALAQAEWAFKNFEKIVGLMWEKIKLETHSLIEDMKSLWKKFTDWLTFDGWDDKLRPLDDYETEMMEKIAQRQKELMGDMTAFVKARVDELDRKTQKLMPPEQGKSQIEAGTTEKLGALEKGSQAAFSVIYGTKTHHEKVENLLGDIKKNGDKQLDKLDGIERAVEDDGIPANF